MKIAFFTLSLSKGGAERVVTNLCNNWPQDDSISIVTCMIGDPQYSLSPAIRYHGLIDASEFLGNGRMKTFFKLCKNYRETIKSIDPDVIICFLPEPCLIATLMNFGIRKKLIGSERGNPLFQYSGIKRRVMDYVYEKMDGVVFQTSYAKELFNKKIQKKSTVIGNPLDKTFFSLSSSNPNRHEVVSVGRLKVEKNYPLLINAFKIVKEKVKDASLKIYGSIDEKLGIRELICENDLDDSVFLMDEVDNVQEKIRNAGLFVMSSKSEGMPNALMEAMALGIPVVSTDCPSGGPRELIEDGVNGLLVENEDCEGLANAMISILADEDMAHRLGQKASETINEYSIEKISMQWVDFIEASINGLSS